MPNEFEAQIVLPNRPSRTRGFEDMGFADRRGKGATSQIRYGTYCWLLRGSKAGSRIRNRQAYPTGRAWNNVCGPESCPEAAFRHSG